MQSPKEKGGNYVRSIVAMINENDSSVSATPPWVSPTREGTPPRTPPSYLRLARSNNGYNQTLIYANPTDPKQSPETDKTDFVSLSQVTSPKKRSKYSNLGLEMPNPERNCRSFLQKISSFETKLNGGTMVGQKMQHLLHTEDTVQYSEKGGATTLNVSPSTTKSSSSINNVNVPTKETEEIRVALKTLSLSDAVMESPSASIQVQVPPTVQSSPLHCPHLQTERSQIEELSKLLDEPITSCEHEAQCACATPSLHFMQLAEEYTAKLQKKMNVLQNLIELEDERRATGTQKIPDVYLSDARAVRGHLHQLTSNKLPAFVRMLPILVNEGGAKFSDLAGLFETSRREIDLAQRSITSFVEAANNNWPEKEVIKDVKKVVTKKSKKRTIASPVRPQRPASSGIRRGKPFQVARASEKPEGESNDSEKVLKQDNESKPFAKQGEEVFIENQLTRPSGIMSGQGEEQSDDSQLLTPKSDDTIDLVTSETT